MEVHRRLLEAVHGPYLARTQINLGSGLVIEKAEIDTETYAGEHHLALQAGLAAHCLANRHQWLLELEIVDSHSGYGSVTELGVCSRRDCKAYYGHKGCCDDFLHMLGLYGRKGTHKNRHTFLIYVKLCRCVTPRAP